MGKDASPSEKEPVSPTDSGTMINPDSNYDEEAVCTKDVTGKCARRLNDVEFMLKYLKQRGGWELGVSYRHVYQLS